MLPPPAPQKAIKIIAFQLLLTTRWHSKPFSFSLLVLSDFLGFLFSRVAIFLFPFPNLQGTNLILSLRSKNMFRKFLNK